MDSSEICRIDKWLWMVRIFKTRSQAADACKGGKVKIDGHAIKPSKEVKPNEIITVQLEQVLKTIQVLDFPKMRIGPKLITTYYKDLTPASALQKKEPIQTAFFISREKGKGRPTKKDRRDLEEWFGF